MNQNLLDIIFPPNKPTLYAPSNKGIKINISGLLNFFMTHGQENKIWLEKKARLKKDYRITVIIDSSRSCFNKDSFYFSFSIVMALLKLITSSMISCVDLIIATDKNPIVLCSGQESNVFNYKSLIWQAIISLLYENKKYESNRIFCNLKDAIHLAIKLRLLNVSKKYISFILTDGAFDKDIKEDIKNIILYCEELQMDIYGIGIGLYPEGIKQIFSKCLWSPDIKHFFSGLSSLIKNENIDSSHFINKTENENDKTILIDDLKKILINISKNPLYFKINQDLYNYLNDYPVQIESLEDVMNKDLFYDNYPTTINPINSNENSMFKKDFFKNLKILICCFWSKNLASKNERDEIEYK